MTTEKLDIEALMPDEPERVVAENLHQELAHRLAQGEAVKMILSGDERGAQSPLPATAAKLPVKVLAEITRGNAVRSITLKPDRKASLRELVALNQKFGVQVGEGH
jgi:hypothetical protein